MINPKPPMDWQLSDLEVHNGIVRLVLTNPGGETVHIWREEGGLIYSDVSDVFGDLESQQEESEAVETYGSEVLDIIWEDLEKSIEALVGGIKGQLIKSAQYQPIGGLGLRARREEEMEF